MKKYNYYTAIIEDVKQYIQKKYTRDEINNLINTREDSEYELYEDLFYEDHVTGNVSGSYWKNTWKAEEALWRNLDLLSDAMKEFRYDLKELEKGAEWADVTIRSYLLGQCISATLDELKEELDNGLLEN